MEIGHKKVMLNYGGLIYSEKQLLEAPHLDGIQSAAINMLNICNISCLHTVCGWY